MYTKEDADVHKKVMKAIKEDMKRPRTWKEFRQLQKQVQSISVKIFDQMVQNYQSSFERVFKNALNMLQMKVIFIVNRGETKNLKKEARAVLEKLTKMITDFEALEDTARKEKIEFTFSADLQRQLIRELKRCVK